VGLCIGAEAERPAPCIGRVLLLVLRECELIHTVANIYGRTLRKRKIKYGDQESSI
jgi:hypothetical protein